MEFFPVLAASVPICGFVAAMSSQRASLIPISSTYGYVLSLQLDPDGSRWH
jgi:hypothetical protein